MSESSELAAYEEDVRLRRELVLHLLRVQRLKQRAAVRGRVAGRWVIVR